MNFTTSDNVAMFLNKTSLTLSETATISMLIGMVDGVIKNYCGWELMAADYTTTLNGDGTVSLALPDAPVNTVTSLVVSDIDYTGIPTLNSKEGVLTFTTASGSTFTTGTANIVVAYNAGYTVVPSDLAYAASWLVAINYNRISQESIGVINEQFNTIKVEYDKVDIPVMVKHVLDRYRQIGIF